MSDEKLPLGEVDDDDEDERLPVRYGDYFDYWSWRQSWLMMWGVVGCTVVYNYSTAAIAQNFAVLTGTPRVQKGIVLP